MPAPLPDVAQFRAFLNAHPPYGSVSWSATELKYIAYRHRSNLSRWLKAGSKFRFSDGSAKHFSDGLNARIATLEADVGNANLDEAKRASARDELSHWRRFRVDWKKFLAGHPVLKSDLPVAPRAMKFDAVLDHSWRPAENPRNAIICLAFLNRLSVPTLRLLAEDCPHDLVERAVRTHRLVEQLLELLVSAMSGYVTAESVIIEGCKPLEVVLRAMFHLFGPRVPRDGDRVFRLCHVAEYCSTPDYRPVEEESSVASKLTFGDQLLLVRALETGKFCEGESERSYGDKRAWRPVHVFAAPVPMKRGGGPIGTAAGVLTLDVFCHLRDWNAESKRQAVEAVAKMPIRGMAQRTNIRSALNIAALVARDILMNATVEERLDAFARGEG